MVGLYRREGPIFIIGAVSVAHFISHIYLLAFPPLFPILGSYFDVTIGQLGLLVTAIYIPQFLLQLPLGVVVDRIGAKRVLVGGLFLTSGAIAVAGLAPTFWILLVFAFISGIGQSVFHPADYALLNVSTNPANEGKGFSAHTFAGFAGFAAAPIIIGGIGIAIDWRLALLVTGLAGLVFTVLFMIFVPPIYSRELASQTPETPPIGTIIRNTVAHVRQWNLLAVFGFYFLSMVAIVGLQSFTTVLGVDSFGFGESMANNLLTAHMAATAIGVLLGGPLADRLPFRGVIIATFALCALTVWLAATVVAPGVILAFAILSCAGLFIGAALPSRDRLANATGDADSSGTRFGFFFTGVSLGATISPAVLGFVIDHISIELAFMLIGGSLFAGALVVALMRLVFGPAAGRGGQAI